MFTKGLTALEVQGLVLDIKHLCPSNIEINQLKLLGDNLQIENALGQRAAYLKVFELLKTLNAEVATIA